MQKLLSNAVNTVTTQVSPSGLNKTNTTGEGRLVTARSDMARHSQLPGRMTRLRVIRVVAKRSQLPGRMTRLRVIRVVARRSQLPGRMTRLRVIRVVARHTFMWKHKSNQDSVSGRLGVH